MSIDDMHRPTTDFREHLEWEVVSAFRRQQRLNARHHAQLSRWLRAAAIVIVSVAIGASATLASAQIRQDARRDSLIDAAAADYTLAALRLQIARVTESLTQDLGRSPTVTDLIRPTMSYNLRR